MIEDPLERRLAGASEVELLGLLRHSSNYTFLARVCDPDGDLLAVYKPARGESPLWDFPTGTLYRREVAAYRLARLLGWPQIPATVVREEGPHGIGALQAFVEAQPDRHFLNDSGQDSRTWEQLALFDFVANNADRKAGHCLVDAGGALWVIDHGLTFHVESKLRTVIWDYAGAPAPADACDDLARALPHLADTMEDLLNRRELGALKDRIEAVLKDSWRFPAPDSAWSIPWPPV